MKKSFVCIIILCAIMSSVMINAEAFITKDTDVVYIVKTNESIYLPQYEDGSVKQFFGVEIVAIKQIEDNIYYVAIKSDNMVNALEVWRYDPKIEHVALLSNIPQRHSDMILLRVTKDIGSKQYENEDVFEFHNISFDNIYCLTIRNSGLTKQEILEKDGYLEFVGMVNTTDLYETVSILKTYDDVLYIEPIFLDLYPDYDYDSIKPADINEPIIKIGDINANEKIDMTDYILLKRAHFGTYTLDESQKARGDINQNGKIDMTDYILLKRMYFGTWVYEEHQSTEDEVLPDDTKQANQFKIKVKEFINLEDYKNQNSSSLYGVEITDIRPKFDESKPHNVIDIYYVIATKDSYTAAELTQLFESEDNVLSCMTHCEDLPN